MTRKTSLLVVALAATVATTGCSSTEYGTARQSELAGAGSAPRHDGKPWPDTGGTTLAEKDPQSTFAVDVDTASYGYARRLINEGRLPARTAIRPEEFVNAFPQNYPEPSGDGVAIHVDGSRMPGTHRPDDVEPEPADPDPSDLNGELRLLRVGLQTRSEDAEVRSDAALTFVIDVSGSMNEPGRLDLVQDALHTLVDQLRRTDSVAIVAFSKKARVVREMTRVAEAEALHDAIDSLAADNSTNLEAGLVLGYRVARDGFRPGQTNRVIVLSDGLANVGNTGATPILDRVREEADKEIALLGVGVGSDYGDELMEQLADRGDGFVVYVSERAQARKVFVQQLPATLSVRALDAKVQVTFDPEAVRSYRLIGYENRAVDDDDDFRNDRVDGGEVGPGHSVTALYEVRLADRVPHTARVARVQVRWLEPTTREAAEAYESVAVADLTGRFEQASARLRTCYAAGFFAESLRIGRNDDRLADLAAIAERAAEETRDRDVRDLADTIDRARELP